MYTIKFRWLFLGQSGLAVMFFPWRGRVGIKFLYWDMGFQVRGFSPVKVK